MSSLFVTSLVVFVTFLAVLAVGIVVRRRSRMTLAVSGGVLILAVAIFLGSCLTQVPAQNTGVVTTFGRPTGKTIGPGLHWKSPVSKVSDMDGTIQQVDNEGENGRTTVRLNNNSLMYVENNLRWRIIPAAAPQLFVDWKRFDHIQDGLVTKELKAALNVVLADYDALDPGKEGQTNDELAKAVIDRLNIRIGPASKDPEIEIITFTIQRIDFDPDTQKRLNAYNEQVARTRTAEESEKTAAAEARANKALSTSVSHDPNVLVSKCLDILKQMSDKGQTVPPAFSCWPQTAPQTTVPTR